MTDDEKLKLIALSWELHSQVETTYLDHPARSGDDEWLEKQRLLLADMALHLLQTALNPEAIELEKLRNNLHSIMTISDQFLPKSKLKKATEHLFE